MTVLKVKLKLKHTAEEVLIGAELGINDNVTFCSNTPPTIPWFQLGKTIFPVDVKKTSPIKTGRNHLEGISAQNGASVIVKEASVTALVSWCLQQDFI